MLIDTSSAMAAVTRWLQAPLVNLRGRDPVRYAREVELWQRHLLATAAAAQDHSHWKGWPAATPGGFLYLSLILTKI